MTQTYLLPTVNDSAQLGMAQLIPDCLEALRTLHSGGTAPSNTIAYMLWADTGTGWLKMRNAANNAWFKVLPLAADLVLQLSTENWFVSSLAATRTAKLGVCPRAGTVKRLVLFGETASTSSSGNEWQPMLKCYPNSAPGSPVNLFSGTVGTFTALSGVGGGVEFAANKALTFTPNQNLTVADLDLLELVMTKAGTATSLANFRALVEIE